ncbi:hypothetical protein ACQKL0_01460 [Peribacillus sp. NPDC097264]
MFREKELIEKPMEAAIEAAFEMDEEEINHVVRSIPILIQCEN